MPDSQITVRKAAELLGLTSRMVHYLIAGGKFPGARKIDPDIGNSDMLLPLGEVMAEKKRRDKAEQSD